MTYRLLRQDARPEFMRAMRVRLPALDRLHGGLPMDAPEVPVRVALSPHGVLPSDVLELPCLVVSDSTRSALEGAGVDNVQYFPAELQVEYSSTLTVGYWIANVIGTVSCVDREASQFEPGADGDDGELRSFQIDPLKTYGLSLFRLAEEPRLVVVSARVQAALEGAKLRGLILQDTQAYDGHAASSAADGVSS